MEQLAAEFAEQATIAQQLNVRMRLTITGVPRMSYRATGTPWKFR